MAPAPKGLKINLSVHAQILILCLHTSTSKRLYRLEKYYSPNFASLVCASAVADILIIGLPTGQAGITLSDCLRQAGK